MYLPGIRTPSGMPSLIIPVVSLADHANNAMRQNFLPPGIIPAEYANYMSTTNGIAGNMSNHVAGMHHLNQPYLQNLDMIAYQYHQINCNLGVDKSFPPKPN
jgi:hypothetical protein